jgi:uncharacterized membrane protein HdeD (DUF308 family)
VAYSDEPQFWMIDNLLLFVDDIFTIILACNYFLKREILLIILSILATTPGVYHRILGLDKLMAGEHWWILIINVVKGVI